jgi:hypothetical protein
MTWTIQTLIDSNVAATGHCQNSKCNHHQELDLEMLKERLGPDAPATMADDLKSRLKCSKCGGQAVALIYSPRGNQQRSLGANRYLKAKFGR